MKKAAEILSMSRAELARLVALQQLQIVQLENDLSGLRGQKIDLDREPEAREVKRAIFVTFRSGGSA